MGKTLVRLITRPSRDDESFHYLLEYKDKNGHRRRISLGHADRSRAERERAQKERELRMDVCAPEHVRLSKLLADHLEQTRGQVQESTLEEHDTAMRHLIDIVGDIDLQEVRHHHGERFLQTCLDRGNSPATAHKKTKSLKRVFQLAVRRGQLETNPFRYIQRPKIPQQEIHVYTDDECRRLLRVARELREVETESKGLLEVLDGELLIALALCTGTRRGELLNLTWRDVDISAQSARVAPKQNTASTWEWLIKDGERRTLPLTDELIPLLIQHQEQQPEGQNPYVLIPPARYERIQQRRSRGAWTAKDARCPINNFKDWFDGLRSRAAVDEGTFHDLRRTCLTRWIENGLSEFDVMNLAGHSDFQTTHRFYLAVRRDLLSRARDASWHALGTRPPETLTTEEAADHKQPAANHLQHCVRRDSNPQPSVPKTEALSN